MRSQSLEGLRQAHDRATSANVKGAVRLDARRLAERLGVSPPEWCAMRRATPKRVYARKAQPLPPGRPFVTTKPRKPVQRSPRVDRAPDALVIARTIEIPEALREWRARNAAQGACVQIGRDGVSLHVIGGVQRFRTIDAAMAAVARA